MTTGEGGCTARSAPAMFAPPICRRSRRNASRAELILSRQSFVGSDEVGGSSANIAASAASHQTASAASAAIKPGSRAAVLRRSEGTRLFVPE